MKNNQNSSITNDNNQGSVVAQTAHSSLEDSLKQEIQSLKKEVKSLKAQSRWNSGIIGLGVIGLIGYAIATNWSAFAATGTAIAAVLPVIGIAVATIVAATVLVGASYLAWRHRAEIKAGFKYAAEKTVEGAKDLYGRAKKVVNSVTYYDHDHQNAFLKKMTEFTPENYKNYEEIREQLKVISNEKDGNVPLKNILSEIGSMIDSKIADKEKLANTDLPKASDKSVSDVNEPVNTNQSEADKLLSEWKMQREFIKGLNSQKLKKLVNNKGLPSDYYMINKVFSEHHSEIKEITKEREIEHKLSKALENLNKVAGKYGRRVSSTQPTPSSLTRSGSLSSEKYEDTEVQHTVPPVSDGEVPPATNFENSARSVSPDSGKGPSGSSTPTDRKSSPMESLQDELKKKLKNQFAPIDQPSVESVDQTTFKGRK